MVTDIFITSWKRIHFTKMVINYIHERTMKGTFKIHILDNESTSETRQILNGLLDMGMLESVLYHRQNTRCLWGKAVFQAMVSDSSKYYVVTDNDIEPPKLPDKDWLQSMIDIMDSRPDIAMLTPQFPPVNLSEPIRQEGDIILCKAVGNAFKMTRRNAYPDYPQHMDSFGDDGMISALLWTNGYKVAFCSDIFCRHIGQTENWGYKPEEIALDPRKSGYGPPFIYEPEDPLTLRPPEYLRYREVKI